MPAEATLSPAEFEKIRALAYKQFGLDLKPGKESLVLARLGKRMRVAGVPSVQQYLDVVTKDASGTELCALIDALTTNHTSFLREPSHFEFLTKKIVPTLKSRHSFTIWCAGCATGEETYTLLFTALDAVGAGRFKILATDISNRALDAARQGVYAMDRVQGLPPDWKSKYLQAGKGDWQGHVRVKPALQSHIEFRRLNLMEPIDHIPQVPVIFCRNVMIYFDAPTQQNLIHRFTERLEPGGYLCIGHSEGLMGIRHGLEYVMPATYRKPGTLKP